MVINDIKTTFIIDDDPIFIFVLKKLLEKHSDFGCIIDFKSSTQALERLFEENFELPSLILLDLNMPQIDGWQFLDKLVCSDNHKEIIVFILSSSIDVNDIERSKKYSIVKGFISKPVTHDKLTMILESVGTI